MRISDWSSVVCSSDLIQGSTRKLNASTRPGRAGTTPGRRHARGAGPGLRKTNRMHAPSTRKTLLALTLAAAFGGFAALAIRAGLAQPATPDTAAPAVPLHRAARRERLCQDVLISWVTVSL